MVHPIFSKIKEIIIEDWEVKLISLFLSLFLWFFVDSLSYQEVSLSLPIQYKNLSSDKVVLEDSPPLIELKVRGKKDKIKKMDFGHLLILKADLSKAKVGRGIYSIELVNLAPSSDLIIHLNQETVRLNIDRKERKNVLIKPRISGSPKDGFVLENIEISNKSVMVEGPSTRLASLSFIDTSAIDIFGRNTGFKQEVSLSVPRRVQVIGDKKVMVEVQIAEQKNTQEEFFQLKLTNLATNFIVESQPKVKLLLTIPGRYQKSFRDLIRVTADCASIEKPGTYRVPLVIKKPALIKILTAPEFISLKFLKKVVY